MTRAVRSGGGGGGKRGWDRERERERKREREARTTVLVYCPFSPLCTTHTYVFQMLYIFIPFRKPDSLRKFGKGGGLGAEFENYCFYEETLKVKKNVSINIEEALSKTYPYVESL